MSKIIKTIAIAGAMVVSYIAGATIHNQRTFDEDDKSNTGFTIKIPANNDKPETFIPTNDYKQGYTDGCLDTQYFWNDIDPNSYNNFFMEKIGDDKYYIRENRKQTPLENFLNSPDKSQSRSYFKIPSISQ